MSTTPPSLLSSRCLDPENLLHTFTWKLNRHPERSTSKIKLLNSIPSISASSWSFHLSHFILPEAQTKFPGRRISVFMAPLSCPIWFLRRPRPLYLQNISALWLFSPPPLLLSRSTPLLSLPWLLQWRSKYLSWDHHCPSTIHTVWIFLHRQFTQVIPLLRTCQ